MPRESEKKRFLFHIAQLLHCWRKNILNINMALGLKAFLKRHFNAMTFSKVNSHKNSQRPKSLQLIVRQFIYFLVDAYRTHYV